MKYRTNKRTGDKISEIGLGTAYKFDDAADGVRALRMAYEGGVNYFDLGAGHVDTLNLYGEALSDVRHDVMYQIHFGAVYPDGGYAWSICYDEIGLISKYYDLALAGDAMAVEHYRALPLNATSCTACGHCDSRCPFGVTMSTRMAEIAAYMA